jgi:hypothetical protein
MRRLVAWGSATIAAALVLTFAPPTAASSRASHYQLGLKLVYELGGASAVLDVTAPAKDAAWAFGVTYSAGNGTYFLLHWNGHGWHKSRMPVRGYQPYAIASSSASDVWLFGVTRSGTAEALSWNGRQWIPVLEPDIGRLGLSGVAVLSPADVWIGVQGTVYHDVGGIWTSSHIPGSRIPGDFDMSALSASSDRNVWVAGSIGTPGINDHLAAYRWEGGAWRRVSMPRTRAVGADIAAESRRNVWISNGTVVLHWNGRKWRRLVDPSGAGADQADFAPYGRDGIWVDSTDVWTGSFWLVVLGYDRHGNPVFGNALAPIPGTDRTWLVGDSHSGAVIMRTHRIGG